MALIGPGELRGFLEQPPYEVRQCHRLDGHIVRAQVRGVGGRPRDRDSLRGHAVVLGGDDRLRDGGARIRGVLDRRVELHRRPGDQRVRARPRERGSIHRGRSRRGAGIERRRRRALAGRAARREPQREAGDREADDPEPVARVTSSLAAGRSRHDPAVCATSSAAARLHRA
jgi:hypothetical protein